MKIAFKKTELVALKDLQEFQGELKELSKENYDKLYRQIKKKFTMPFAVWQDKKGIIHMLDGHQRKRVINELIIQGEPDIPKKFPCNFIKADSMHEAKEILMSFISQYGRMTDEGLYQFAIENHFDPQFLKDNFNFPGLDLELFCDGYFGDGIETENDPNKEWEGMPEFEQERMAIRTVHIHFKTEDDIKEFAGLMNQKITEKTKYLWFPMKNEE